MCATCTRMRLIGVAARRPLYRTFIRVGGIASSAAGTHGNGMLFVTTVVDVHSGMLKCSICWESERRTETELCHISQASKIVHAFVHFVEVLALANRRVVVTACRS